MGHPLYIAGVGIVSPERSYTHKLPLSMNPDTKFGVDMSTKNENRQLIDLSSGRNHATVVGACRSGGYFADGLQFVNNYVRCTPNSNLAIGTSDFIMTLTFKTEQTTFTGLFGIAFLGSGHKYGFYINDATLKVFLDDGVSESIVSCTTNKFLDGKIHMAHAVFKRDSLLSLYVDGMLQSSVDISSIQNTVISTSTDLYLGAYPDQYHTPDNFFTGEFYTAIITKRAATAAQIKTVFNSNAALTLYSFKFDEYPANTTEHTFSIPYTTAIIKTGVFKLNGALECVSASGGTLTTRNNHTFDGDEYITITVNGVEYGGTGSVSADRILVSISKGSSKINYKLGYGDKIENIKIQFRKQVQ